MQDWSSACCTWAGSNSLQHNSHHGINAAWQRMTHAPCSWWLKKFDRDGHPFGPWWRHAEIASSCLSNTWRRPRNNQPDAFLEAYPNWGIEDPEFHKWTWSHLALNLMGFNLEKFQVAKSASWDHLEQHVDQWSVPIQVAERSSKM